MGTNWNREFLRICYYISCSGYSLAARQELYDYVSKNIDDLDTVKVTLQDCYGIAIPDEEE